MRIRSANRTLVSRLRLGALVPALLVVLVAVEALLFVQGARERQLDYDEGVYLASVDALRHGQRLGTAVFTSQPPGFYDLLRVGSFVFGDSEEGLRALIVVSALGGCLAAFAFGRRVGGARCGFLCSAILAIAPSYSTYAGRVSADLPAATFLLVALALAIRPGARAGEQRVWMVIGAVVGVSFTIKLSAVTIAPTLAIFLIRAKGGRVRAALAALIGFFISTTALALLHAPALRSIWRGAVTYHVAARGISGAGTLGGNAHRIVHYLDFRTGFGWLALGAIVIAPFVIRSVEWVLVPLLAWTLTVAVFLTWQRPLHDNHMVLLAVALALPTGVIINEGFDRSLRFRHMRIVATAGIALLFVGGYVQEQRRLVRNQIPLSADSRWAVAEIRRRSSPDDLVVTDQQGLAYLADRRVPGKLVDTAVLRFDSHLITVRAVERQIEADHIGVVVAGRAFTHFPSLIRWLDQGFPHRIERGGLTVFWRR